MLFLNRELYIHIYIRNKNSFLIFIHPLLSPFHIPSTLSPHIYSILYTYLFSLKYPFHPLYFVVDANQIVLALMLHRITLREMLWQSFKCNWFYHRIIFKRQNILVHVAALYNAFYRILNGIFTLKIHVLSY